MKRRKRKKISLFGNFGKGNLGNESTLQAILYHLRQHLPDAEVNCICTGPEATAITYNITAVPMCEIFVNEALFRSNPLAKFLRKVFIGIPIELYRWLKAIRILKGTSMLIVPGTQFLSDNLTSPFGWPYLAFKWSVASKIRGCKLLFVSVGVGPLRHRLSRIFVKSALFLADYRSYRDDLSKQYLRHIGFDSTDDPVYPDLAFSFPVPATPHSNSNNGKPVIAVGVKDYQGQYGPTPQKHRADIYRRYIGKVADFTAWLLENLFTVRLIIGDVVNDPQVIADLRKTLDERGVKYEKFQVIDEPIESLEQLVSAIATNDIIVSSRYHNVVLGLLLNRPVIALAYHEKFSAVMEESDLAKYNLHIDHLDVSSLIAKFVEIVGNNEELKLHISRKVEKYRTALAEQYRFIFRDLLQE